MRERGKEGGREERERREREEREREYLANKDKEGEMRIARKPLYLRLLAGFNINIIDHEERETKEIKKVALVLKDVPVDSLCTRKRPYREE